jgi:hypothetical protein
LRDVLGPQTPVEIDRGVQPLEVRMLRLVEAGHARSVYGGHGASDNSSLWYLTSLRHATSQPAGFPTGPTPSPASK